MVKFLKLLEVTESVLHSQGQSAKHSWGPVLCRGLNPVQKRFISSVSPGVRSSPQAAKHLSTISNCISKVCPGFVHLGIAVLVEKAGDSALKYCSFAPMQVLIFNFLYLHAVGWVLHRSTQWAKGGQAEQSRIRPSVACWYP